VKSEGIMDDKKYKNATAAPCQCCHLKTAVESDSFLTSELLETTIGLPPIKGCHITTNGCCAAGQSVVAYCKQEAQLKLGVADRTKPEVEIWRRPTKSTF